MGIKNKAQMRMMESIAVLIVFFFLVGIGINFYAKIQIQGLADAKAEFASADAIKISQKIAHMPELRCSLVNTDQGSCIDLYQAKAWEKLAFDDRCSTLLGPTLCAEKKGHYFEQIGFAEVILKVVYSSDSIAGSTGGGGTVGGPGGSIAAAVTGTEYRLYEFKPDTEGSSTFTQIPVAIYDPTNNVKGLGILQVRVYHD